MANKLTVISNDKVLITQDIAVCHKKEELLRHVDRGTGVVSRRGRVLDVVPGVEAGF
jgi:hypothetical protein